MLATGGACAARRASPCEFLPLTCRVRACAFRFKAISAGNYDRFWRAHLRNVPASSFPAAVQRFLNQLFVADPEGRADVETLLRDPWLADAQPLEPRVLTAQMTQRKATVDAEKKAEAEAARKKKERERARRAPREANDPFSRILNRAAGELAPPPLLPADYFASGMSRRYTYALSSAEADRILERLRDICAALAEDAGLLKLNVEEYKLRATVRAPGRSAAAGDDDEAPPVSETTVKLTFSVQLYRMPPDSAGAVEDVHLVDFVRRAGDQMDFLRLIHEHVCPQLASVEISCGGDEPTSTSSDVAGSGEDVGVLSGDLGVI